MTEYLFDGLKDGHYVRAWKDDTTREAAIAVQIWLDKSEPTGEPDEDWIMPWVLGLDLSIAQALAQTRKD